MINIQIDSRQVKKGDIFVAIKGSIVDGHDYVEQAIENGATTVVVQNNKQYSVKTINVKKTNEYLTNLLIDNYSKEFNDLKIVGVTGTNGKTTIAYMTYQLLRTLNVKAAYIGTIGFFYNDNFEKTLNTTPDILNMYKYLLKAKEDGCKVIILEASSIGLMEGRLAGLKYDIAVFTNLTHEHLDYHKTMTKYQLAKYELFKNLKNTGCAITNIDDKYGKYFTGGLKTITYGFKEADIKCISHDKSYSKFSYEYQGQTYEISSKLFGKYNVYNIMASLGILINLGFNIKEVNKIYPKLNTPNGRINIIDYKDNKIIIDYAHTPDGIKQVLLSVTNLAVGKTYVIFGCPGQRDRSNRPMMSKIVNKYADYFIITDDDPHYEDEMQIINDITKGLKSDKYEIIVDRKKAISKGISLLKKNDILLILGKGHENAIVIKDKRIPHNDSKYVQEVIEKEKCSIK